MFNIDDKDIEKIIKVEKHWNDKMPLMACEEFSELQEAIIRYESMELLNSKNYTVYSGYSGLNNIFRETVDVVISILAFASYVGMNPNRILKFATSLEDTDYVSEDQTAKVMFYLTKCTQAVSKYIRDKYDSDDYILVVFSKTLVLMYNMCTMFGMKDEEFDRKLTIKLAKNY
jgi:hypothetical protein